MKQDPTLLEPRFLRARFCDFNFGDILSAGISLFAGSQAAGAAEDASQAMVRAAEIAAGESRNALAFTKEAYNVGRADLAPYRATGAGALQTMNQMFIPGGHQMVQLQGQLNELRAQRARLTTGGGASGQAGAQGGLSQEQLGALRQIWDAGRGGDGGPGAGADDPQGRDNDFGVAEWSGSFEDWASTVASFLGGPVGIISGLANQIYSAETTGDAGGGIDPSVAGDIAAAATAAGGAGPGAGPGSEAAAQGGGDRDGGDYSGGMGGGGQTGEDTAGPGWHKGGPVTDHNPKTYRNNMRITAQEGEVVMSRPAVKMLGRNFLIRANKAANRKGSK
jgi:hypothetical protein